MAKYLRYLGLPGARFEDTETGTMFESYGEAQQVSADRAKYLTSLSYATFEEVNDASAKDTVTQVQDVSERVDKLGGEVRYRDPESGAESLTPIVKEVKE
jgi:hypothetical protein